MVMKNVTGLTGSIDIEIDPTMTETLLTPALSPSLDPITAFSPSIDVDRNASLIELNGFTLDFIVNPAVRNVVIEEKKEDYGTPEGGSPMKK